MPGGKGADTHASGQLHAWNAEAPAFKVHFQQEASSPQKPPHLMIRMYRLIQHQLPSSASFVGFLIFCLLEAIHDTLTSVSSFLWHSPYKGDRSSSKTGHKSNKFSSGSKDPVFTIVPFQPAHQHAAVRLWTDGLNQTLAASPASLPICIAMWLFFKAEAFNALQPGGSLRDIKAHWMRPRGHFFVALDSHGKVVGCVACKEGDTGDWKEEEIGCVRCRLTRLSVTSQCRGMGVGRALVDAVEGWARGKGMTEVVCMTSNVTATKFYKRVGFEVSDERPMYNTGVVLTYFRKEL